MYKYVAILLLVGWMSMVAIAPLKAEVGQGRQSLGAVADAFISVESPTGNQAATSDLQLTITYREIPFVHLPNSTVYCPEVSEQILLQFDLSAVAFPIANARLSLQPTAKLDSFPSIELGATLADWSEDTVTWDTQPALHTMLGAGSSLSADGMLVWEDADGDMDNTVAEWLEYRRQSNDHATLVLAQPANGYCWPYQPDRDVLGTTVFDRQSGMGAMLELSSAEVDLNALASPTSVTIQSNAISNGPSRTLLLVILLVGFATLFVCFMDD